MKGTPGWVKIVLICLVGLIPLCVIYSLFMQANNSRRHRQNARDVHAHTEIYLEENGCRNNLQRIGLAMQQYEVVYGSYPPSTVVDDAGKPLYSWRVLLLPFLGEDSTYRQFRLDEAWNSSHNYTLSHRNLSVFHCPHQDYSGFNTNYFAIVGKDAPIMPTEGRKVEDFKSERSHTPMIVEVHDQYFNWAEPADLDADRLQIVARSTDYTSVNLRTRTHDNAMRVVMADGRVSDVYNVSPNHLRSLFDITEN